MNQNSKSLSRLVIGIIALISLAHSQTVIAGACSSQAMMLKELKLDDYAKIVGSLSSDLDHMIMISGEMEEESEAEYVQSSIDFRARGANFKLASLEKNEVGVDLARNYNTVSQLVRIYDEELCQQQVLIVAEKDGIVYGFDTLADIEEGDYEEILGYREGDTFIPDSGFKVSAFVLRYKMPSYESEETKVLDEMEIFFVKRQMRSS